MATIHQADIPHVSSSAMNGALVAQSRCHVMQANQKEVLSLIQGLALLLYMHTHMPWFSMYGAAVASMLLTAVRIAC